MRFSPSAFRRILWPAILLGLASGTAARAERFTLCPHGGGSHCVVDGDTFWMDGEKIRIAGIDTPETHGPRCEAEAVLGARATGRLRELLNAGPFAMKSVERDRDRYGRSLRILWRDGGSLGERLVKEGLARPWKGSRQPWCRS